MHAQPQISLQEIGPPLSSSGGRRIHRLGTDYFICRTFSDNSESFTHNQLTLAKALNRQRSVKSIAIMLSVGLFALSGCALGKKMLEQPSGPSQKQSAKLERKTEVFTGKVVLVDGAYRLSLLKDPDTLLRLTRARRETEFAQQQINLRKYYEKTISVNGTLQDDWIFGADIVGQWTPPGGDTGPNMNAPKQTRP